MGAVFLGASAWCGWGVETTWGTLVTRTKFYKPAGGETVKWEPTMIEDPSLGGASVEKCPAGTSMVKGDIPFPVRYEGLELPWKHLFGSATVAPDGSGYKHTFVVADDLPVGLTMEIFRGGPSGKSFVIPGCKQTKGVFEIAKNAPLMYKASILGKSEALATSSSPTYPTAALIIPSQLVVTKVDLTGLVDVLGARIELTNALTDDRFDLGTGGTCKEPVRSGKRIVQATIDGEFSEEAQYVDWASGIEGKIVWTWTGALISGATYYKLVATLHGVFSARPPQVSDAGPVKMSATFKGYKDSTDNEFKLELTNTVVSIP